jgi:ABC-type transporter Mla subunit MlaD
VREGDSNGQPSAEEQLRALYENAESTTARAFEQAVSTPSFGALLARSGENVAALSRIGSDVADLVLRNLRVAGRSDITRLARQLHRTEDKLERVLQEIEQLRDELAAAQAGSSGTGPSTARAGTAPGRGGGDDGEGGGSSTSRRRTSARGSSPGSTGPTGSRGPTGSTRSRSRTT